METRLRNFTYDVKTKNVDVLIQDNVSKVNTENKDVAVITSVVVEDPAETRNRSETVIESVKPYGIELTNKGDVETSVKAEPDVVQEHVEKAIKKNTKKSK